MKIIVNGKQRDFGGGTTLADLIARLALTDRKIAIEVNLEIIPAGKRHCTPLAEGDRIEIIEAVGGG